LSRTDLAATDAWKAHAQVLREMLDHHIKKKERSLFAEPGEHFTDEQREAMGTEFVARKEALLSADRSAARKAA
jgi:hypothetical protein